MTEQPENVGKQDLTGIRDAIEDVVKELGGAITEMEKKKEEKPAELPVTPAPESKPYESFGEYMKAEGQEKREKALKEKWEGELLLAEKDLAEFKEKAEKYAKSEDPVDRASYDLHIRLKEEEIGLLKKLLGR
ncbi:hypothetical protein A2926_02325 [Candidatus Giovannonibacteria bacterium RIFCSPLOWO2_01_FULL_44_40]|uniref:DUF5667 domain-containing protein n=1 Tax=Candidatus Giovannonibacteria bacterium RIFCSPHIGHO2_01_FULL_45_23 TaxID=1798325 RepID=A0A1F5VHL3_9BACT|nr:MAG: hypothetical protein A2834_02440 [Candidatus Giovannonibacteria bacterium RIFCSPHIGHO2_01_FULL_45_23]OGF75569.1 MAG: hypothetical protein A3C77_01925 [Candidatus Giovannonibacteria bacterium RIFCSPHIGHO2_02_FULL_45_13]OGF79987.1 MAG: hypothetical protein A2926_02325 [Candidatus Giovannonibacteria bacterium RIFCSPLOWO2_01_FULL_44_40]